MKEKDNNFTYPRFISNKPCGTDKYEGKSQKRLTNAIVNHIISIDSSKSNKISRIIGLEGGWGVGKSNVIKQIDKHKDIKNNYYLFEYDAWGHQEDLQRRSFLEVLTTELVNEKILCGNTEINIKGGETKTVSWNEKLKYLLARKSETSTETCPRLSKGVIMFGLLTILTPIAFSIANMLKENCLALSILLLFVPLLLGLVCLLRIRIKEGREKAINEVFSIYSGKLKNEVTYETISDEEPTVTEFKEWMQDISDHLGKINQKIIIVYDNMDRLPPEKVKELWSSIHTFFSEGGFDNVWAIIPFDEVHLSYAFGELGNEKDLTKYFISKTFPIVYHVTPPIITDFKCLFNILFEEAFEKNEINNQETINRIFRLEKPTATVREIIDFINQLVMFKNIWANKIDLLHIAIFVLRRDKLSSDNTLAGKILSGDYLGQYIPNIVLNDEILQKSITALKYGVSLDLAEQIPMSNYINSCFNSDDTNINKYASSRNFIHILTDKVRNIDIAQLKNVIQSMSQLDTSAFSDSDKKTITDLWNYIAQRRMRIPMVKQEFDTLSEFLLINSDSRTKGDLVKYLCEQIQLLEAFDSENYYNALKNLESFLKFNNIEIEIADNIVELEKDPKTFVDFVLSAKSDYTLYKMKTNPKKLSAYLSENVIEQYSVLEVIEYLREDKRYTFNEVKDQIEKAIQKPDVLKKNNFKPLLDAYKALSPYNLLDVQLNIQQRQTIWEAFKSEPDTSEYLEILTIQIANGANISHKCNDKQIEYIANNIEYYAIYGDILINSIRWNNPLLNQVLKFMIKNKLGTELYLEDVLPKFIDIKNRLEVEESTLLEHLNRWEEQKREITVDNIKNILINTPQFFLYSKKTNNKLTNYLNTTIIEALSRVTKDTLYKEVQQPNSFWSVIINSLIGTDFLRSLPDNVTEIGKQLLDDVAGGRLQVPQSNSTVYNIIDNLDRKFTKETITQIKNEICNNKSGYNVDPNKFQFLHEWLESQGDLASRAGDVCQYIFTPVVNDENSLKIMIQRADFYVPIIKAAKSQANSFKQKIESQLSKNSDQKLVEFAKKIGVEINEQDKE
ncbi:MAG: P-loop NTPase fold protein [Bacteroidales bacterium]|jgi:hypothetical protein|nr:P-loop NTPase fold protein [Bacteroidales bacterium]